MLDTELNRPDLLSGEFRISYDHVRAYRRGYPLNLRPKELKLFELFLMHRGEVLTREYLASCISDKDDVAERTIDVHIMRLRKNLRLRKWKDPITTIRETGYLFCKD
ncbi:MAG: winged helix family transcriptional regulator [Methylocystaceae bacterium]|nr:winged helix family transcriptional regulator [Methylocystaceae bacterium]